MTKESRPAAFHFRHGGRAVVLAGLVLATAACQAQISTGGGQAPAGGPPQALTWMVLNEINSASFDRAEPMNRPPLVTEVPDGMIREVNVSSDGTPDWLIDYSSQGGQWCGTGGCLRTLYVSDGEDYVMALDAQVLDMEIADQGGQPTLDLTVHHLYCQENAETCRYGYGWDATQKALVPRDDAAVAATHADGFNLMSWHVPDAEE